MDSSIGNMANDNIPDKVTIKVKVAGEDYHDLVIDWSDASGPYKGQQVIHQLSSITGIPVKYIDKASIVHSTYAYYNCYITNTEGQRFEPGRWLDEFTKENCFESLNDGDCFVVSIDLWHKFGFGFWVSLVSSVYLANDRCTNEFCLYSNNRAFLNRQIAIATNSELLRKLNEALPDDDLRLDAFRRLEVYRNFNIRTFINHIPPWCSSRTRPRLRIYRNYNDAGFFYHYSRTSG